MERFPQMLYRFPAAGPDVVALQDGIYGAKVVGDDAELEVAMADGWHETSPAARAANDAQLATALATTVGAGAAPTRAELEAKATELGIKFDGRTGDKKLGDQIAAALEP